MAGKKSIVAYKGKETAAEEAAEHGLTMRQVKTGARMVGKSAARGVRRTVRKAGKAVGKAAKSMARLPGKMVGKAGRRVARKTGKTVGKAVHKARMHVGRKVLFAKHPVTSTLKKLSLHKAAKVTGGLRNKVGRKIMGFKKR